MHNTNLLHLFYHSRTDRPSYMAAGLKVPVPMLPRSFVSERVGKRSRSPRTCISKQAFFIKKECRVKTTRNHRLPHQACMRKIHVEYEIM